LGRYGQGPEFGQATCRALVRCILGKFLGIICHCFPPRLDVLTFAARCLHVRHNARDPSGGRWNYGRECRPVIFAEMTTSTPFRDLLLAATLRRGKEGVLRNFSPLKIRRLRPGLNLRTWVLKASTLPLDHRSPCKNYVNEKIPVTPSGI